MASAVYLTDCCLSCWRNFRLCFGLKLGSRAQCRRSQMTMPVATNIANIAAIQLSRVGGRFSLAAADIIISNQLMPPSYPMSLAKRQLS